MKLVLIGLALVSSLATSAQTVPSFTSACQSAGANAAIYTEDSNHSFNGQKQFCETRDLAMSAPTAQPLTIDGGTNGGITVRGWDGSDVRIRAKIQTWGASEQEAQTRAKAITISTSGNTLRAMPTNVQQAAVSFEVFVPRHLALALTTHNGGISLAELQATISFQTQNGGVALTDLGGQVTGKATNGGLSIRLSGNQWAGDGLNVETVNGGITWHLPIDYSAQFFTSTNNGSLHTMLPQSDPKSHRHEIKTTLGKGGQPVKAVTTNGSVTIKQG